MLAALLVTACGPPYAPPPRHGGQPPQIAPSPAPTAAPAATPAPTPAPAADRLVLREGAWAELPGWNQDAVAAALPALVRSCAVWRAQGGVASAGPPGVAGTPADWLPLCAGVAALRGGDDAGLRRLFEERLRPVAVSNGGETQGLFTGYYEAALRGSRVRTGPYSVPLYVRPPELVSVDLGRFRADLKGKRIAGRVEQGALVPYFDRGAIQQGALAERGLELVWVDDPVDAFFLEIQGSGRIQLTDGSEMRVGYAGQNGFPYVAIGRELVARGALAREQVSMQSIREWLAANPREAAAVMRTNGSYVFFREQLGEGPLGALGVALTPERSLAVDPLFVPLGVPVWIDTSLPASAPGGARPLQRLLVAQDTGGAINGAVRGDVFWGHGEQATAMAGGMRQPGRLWLLLPRSVTLPPTLTTAAGPAAPVPTPPR